MDIKVNSTINQLSIDNLEINILTHNGTFHSDEVFASALITFFMAKNKKVRICRSRKEQHIKLFLANKNSFTIDIGGEYQTQLRNFDHHQDDVTVEGNASVMLILNYLHEISIFDDALYNYLKDNLVQFLNNWDLGLEQGYANFRHKPIPTIISSFNRFNATEKVENQQFKKALDFAILIIENEVDAYYQLLKAKAGFKKHRNITREIIIFDDYYPQYAKLIKQCAKVRFYIHPLNDKWAVKTTDSELNPLPLINDSDELVFAHKNRFLSIFTTRHAAIDYIAEKESVSY